MAEQWRVRGIRGVVRGFAAAGISASLMLAAGCRAKPAAEPDVGGPRINSIETVVDDMRLKNDTRLAGIPEHYGWSRGPGQVVMGNLPRGTNTPDWWKPADAKFKSAQYWRYLSPWFVIFDADDNTAVNTRVELRRMKVFVLSRATRQWRMLGAGAMEGYLYPKHLQDAVTKKADARQEPNDRLSVRPPGGDLVFHGWCCGRLEIDPTDIGAVFVTMQARLAADRSDRPDDRQRARFLLQVGADYYPERHTQVSAFAPVSFNPGIGASRSKLIGPDWQAYNFATIDAGVVMTGVGAMATAAFVANPPPLE